MSPATINDFLSRYCSFEIKFTFVSSAGVSDWVVVVSLFEPQGGVVFLLLVIIKLMTHRPIEQTISEKASTDNFKLNK